MKYSFVAACLLQSSSHEELLLASGVKSVPPFLDPQLAYLCELEVEGLIAASPLAKTLCEIKQALVKLQQPSDRCNPGNKA